MDKSFCEIFIVFYTISQSYFEQSKYSQKSNHLAQRIGTSEDPHSEVVITTDYDRGKQKLRSLKQKRPP